ncbi:hypothetical protein E1J38_005065 [Seonamhaeicola sediminis]|uniref:Uncharacterized protein n=1 Tax=Seonamhaeicola sediminis TaxID=2528206 RepID=A0A562YF88_9FLAO|nr:hypothetical protein [Seonamhaeicola sediminis]TWO33268.1 hypothetical protein E1J38_005065 [Seonamhaeicola sediminis]
MLILTKSNNKKVEIRANDIWKIKTKRLGGHNFGMGILIGTTVGAISGATLFESDSFFSRGDNTKTGVVLGAPAGAAIGGYNIV